MKVPAVLESHIFAWHRTLNIAFAQSRQLIFTCHLNMEVFEA